MNATGIRGYLMGLVFPVLVLAALVVFEVYGNVVERGVGYYLKWHNADRQQLGRSWDKERKNILAQNKIQSILASLDLQAQSNESIESFKDLLETLSSPRIISREKFLRLYFDYPGQWLHPIIAPYELLEIDSDKKWSRVLLSRTDLSVSVGFVDQQNNPIREVVLSSDVLEEIRDSRTIRRGLLEDAGFKGDLLFPIREFLPLLQTLDLAAQRSLFPDPEWFLKKDYHVTRMGVLAEDTVAMLGVEYKTDFYTEVLLIPLSPEVANNILSQIERSDFGISKPRLGKVGDEPREEMR